MECIICRKEKTDMSDEHVIPESLGEYYHIFTVCTVCNSKLGSNVDSPLIKHYISELYRFNHQIEGKKGYIPNPFSGDFFVDSTKKVKIEIDESNNIAPFFLPSIKCTKNNGVLEKIEIELDTRDEKEIDGIIAKIAKRNNIPKSSIVIDSPAIISTCDKELKGQKVIDLQKFKIGLLKIAYEFAIDSMPNYYSDQKIIEISKILDKADYEKAEKFIKIWLGSDHRFFSSLEYLLYFESKKHYLVLFNIEDKGLLCLIKLHETFSMAVMLSDNYKSTNNNLLIGVNDIENKTFRKIDGEQLFAETHHMPEVEPQYYFDTPYELAHYQYLRQSPEFKIEQGADCFSLYLRNGKPAGYTFSTLIETIAEQAQIDSLPEGGTITTVQFPQAIELYLKALPTGTLLRFIGFRMTRRQSGKI